eukprot:gene3052-5983_t
MTILLGKSRNWRLMNCLQSNCFGFRNKRTSSPNTESSNHNNNRTKNTEINNRIKDFIYSNAGRLYIRGPAIPWNRCFLSNSYGSYHLESTGIQWKYIFSRIGITDDDLQKLWNLYCKIRTVYGTEYTHVLPIRNLLEFLTIEPIAFIYKVLSIFKSNNEPNGEFDSFGEFVFSLWNFCTLNDYFVCKGIIHCHEISMYIKDLYGPGFRSKPTAQKILKKVDANSRLRYHGFTMNMFHLYTKENPQILYRIITIQLLCIKKTFGEVFWDEYREKRNRISMDELWRIFNGINPILFDADTGKESLALLLSRDIQAEEEDGGFLLVAETGMRRNSAISVHMTEFLKETDTPRSVSMTTEMKHQSEERKTSAAAMFLLNQSSLSSNEHKSSEVEISRFDVHATATTTSTATSTATGAGSGAATGSGAGSGSALDKSNHSCGPPHYSQKGAELPPLHPSDSDSSFSGRGGCHSRSHSRPSTPHPPKNINSHDNNDHNGNSYANNNNNNIENENEIVLSSNSSFAKMNAIANFGMDEYDYEDECDAIADNMLHIRQRRGSRASSSNNTSYSNITSNSSSIPLPMIMTKIFTRRLSFGSGLKKQDSRFIHRKNIEEKCNRGTISREDSVKIHHKKLDKKTNDTTNTSAATTTSTTNNSSNTGITSGCQKSSTRSNEKSTGSNGNINGYNNGRDDNSHSHSHGRFNLAMNSNPATRAHGHGHARIMPRDNDTAGEMRFAITDSVRIAHTRLQK